MTIEVERAVSKRPWYHSGLKFRCTGCGDCCTGAPGYVWVNQEEIEALAAVIGVELAEFVGKYTRRVAGRTSLVELSNGDCVFFNNATRQCTVYHKRPCQCRTWPFWESNLATEADWSATGRACRGVGKGALLTCVEIQSLARVVRV